MNLLKTVSFPFVIVLACIFAPVAVSSAEGCNPQTFQGIQTAAGPVAQAALDGITCVADAASALSGGATTIADVVTACSRFGVDAIQAAQVIQSLLANAQTIASDGSAVGATNAALIAHLKALLTTKP